MTENKKNAWIRESERTVLSSPVLSVIEQNCRSSEDESRKFKFYLLRSRDWCNIIPVTEDGKVVLVRQYRIGIADHTLEIPGGTSDAEDADLRSAALREMTEETGYVPLPGARCVALGKTLPNPAIQDNHCHAFVVGPVRKEREQELDPGEMIEVVEVPIAEIPGMLARGEISHALMLNTFLLLMLSGHGGGELLVRQLSSFGRA